LPEHFPISAIRVYLLNNKKRQNILQGTPKPVL